MSGRDLEREVEDRLVRRARPASPRVLNRVLERIATVPQVAPTTVFGGLMDRAVLAVVVAGVLVFAVVMGPSTMDRLAGLAGGPGQTGASHEPKIDWDASRQFRDAPNQLNPAPDGYGNSMVFSYLRNGGAVHDPTGYVLLADFATDGIERWYDANLRDLYLGLDPGTGRLELRPSGGGDESRAVILGWRSPVDASISVSGSVEVDAACGDGIRFSIGLGSSIIEQRAVAARMERFVADIDVRIGDALYFIVEPGSNDECDTTWLTVAIATR